jgi:hypothetical protein
VIATVGFAGLFLLLSVIGVLAVVGIVAYVLALRPAPPSRIASWKIVTIYAAVFLGIVLASAAVAFLVDAANSLAHWTF